MSKCWLANPEERPDFNEISDFMGNLLSDSEQQPPVVDALSIGYYNYARDLTRPIPVQYLSQESYLDQNNYIDISLTQCSDLSNDFSDLEQDQISEVFEEVQMVLPTPKPRISLRNYQNAPCSAATHQVSTAPAICLSEYPNLNVPPLLDREKPYKKLNYLTAKVSAEISRATDVQSGTSTANNVQVVYVLTAEEEF